MSGVEYHFDFPTPLKDILKAGIKTTDFTGRKGPFACAIAHYSVIKSTYELGYESLLVMEDDIRFLNDISLIKKIVRLLPRDYDYAQFERAKPYEMPMSEWLSLKNETHKNTYWIPFRNMRGGGCYALSRNAMKCIIDEMEHVFKSGKDGERLLPNDYYVKRAKHLKRYFCYPNVAVQMPFSASNSDISEYWKRNELDGIHFCNYNAEGVSPTQTSEKDSKDDFMTLVDKAQSRPLQTRRTRKISRIYDGWDIKPLLKIAMPTYEHTTEGSVDAAILWGYNSSEKNRKSVEAALRDNAPIIMCEPGFISSGTTWADKNALSKYRIEHSVMVDRRGQFFDGTRKTDIEAMLNDRSLIPTSEQRKEARRLIDTIVKNRISKYNHQPIYRPTIGRDGFKKVLVIDQSYGDKSIERGCANEETFNTMLQSAIIENPNCDILVKTHPNTVAGKGRKSKAGYYSDIRTEGNVFKVTENINPYSLMEVCDKVYVCTSQFGLEALMAGKEVHTFGLPFYAGWGLTHDFVKCRRRTNRRTLEELVFIFYMMYTTWVMPEENRICSVYEVIDKMIEYRNEMLGMSKPKQSSSRKNNGSGWEDW